MGLPISSPVLTCVGPAHGTKAELIGHGNEVDRYEREVTGHERRRRRRVRRPLVVEVGGVAEEDHAETHTQSRGH